MLTDALSLAAIRFIHHIPQGLSPLSDPNLQIVHEMLQSIT